MATRLSDSEQCLRLGVTKFAAGARSDSITRMPKKDLNQTAFAILQQPAGGVAAPKLGKNAAAVSLGKLGGLARAAKLSKAQLSEAAKKASSARWPTKPDAAALQTSPKHQPRRGVIRPEKD